MSETSEHKASRAYYPLFVSLVGRSCLVVGGGPVGERKVRGLLRAGATVHLAAPELTEWLQNQCRAGRVKHVGNGFLHEQLDGIDLVFAASSDSSVNHGIAEAAQNKRIWCNTATDPIEGSFVLPAVFQRGHLTVAVGTSGASPALASVIRDKLAEQFDDAWLVVLEMMGMLRGIIQSKGLGTEENQKLFRRIAKLSLVELVRHREKGAAVEAICGICRPYLTNDEMNRIWEEAWKAFSS